MKADRLLETRLIARGSKLSFSTLPICPAEARELRMSSLNARIGSGQWMGKPSLLIVEMHL